ncbi:nif-specific transcriptional activator NifA [Marinobacterium mangrovicola]|uniref:Nif-specific regulatory protein n=1 Tax=Marinobacterium mangrovicola TaxID=1476959 RepID=A0A4R1GJ09_9GAMM|nr:nif-specific transcriptional activator NifA [Marinobacterium mangrovicola]TCK08337.1 Nif-specific regulatory protein [Marinobacterium mangrovicola]
MTMQGIFTPRNRSELLDRQLSVLSIVCRTLTRSLDLNASLEELLKVLHVEGGMKHGLVALMDPELGELCVSAVHSGSEMVQQAKNAVRYRRGEGIIGTILQSGNSVVLMRLSSEPKFLDRLALYDWEAPFIGVPLKDQSGEVIGVLSAQPASELEEFLADESRFMEMVANLVVQAVRLLAQVQTQQRNITDERDELRRTVRAKFGFENLMVGHTTPMKQVFDQIRRVAKWDTTVLIRGESGTGKELVACAIHYNSPKAHNSFVRLNCAALPENLLESELFGHEKGAFTGAVKMRQGRFEQADGGTLFLDEIGEISPLFQAKLLRVLQEGEFERVGGNKTIRVNVRIVAATNRDLEKEVREGHFREDLYYRLNIMPINLPALRERKADLPELCSFLLDKLSQNQGRKLSISDAAIRVLMGHNWPGNVRELENVLERAAIMTEDGNIEPQTLSLQGLDMQRSAAPGPSSMPMSSSMAPSASEPEPMLDDPGLDERERVIAALEQAGWVQAKAARLLNMTPRQIAYRIQTMNIDVKKI